MITQIQRKRTYITYRAFSAFLTFIFIFSSIIPPRLVQAQSVLNLPQPGTMVTLSPAFNPAIVTGIKIYPDNPLQFDFIIDIGDDQLQGEALKKESQKLINYFMATLTVPDDEMWVNLSPYEKDRIIADGLSHTEMGRDMLAQDYLLKQLTASLMYPEKDFGKEFWNRVYSKAQAEYGTTEIPMNTFNKIWIVPDEAVVYVHDTNVFVVENHLKVMLEEDYLALESNVGSTKHGLGDITKDDIEVVSGVSAEIIREVLLPEIEKEVNEGKNFANLRQMYNSMLLATWYKKNLKESLLGKIYVDKNKVNGIEIGDKEIKQKIYDQYVEAFEKGVFNYIKEDVDSVTQEVIPRKYFSGGISNHSQNGIRDVATVASPIAAELEEGLYAIARVKGRPLGNVEEVSSPVSGDAERLFVQNGFTPAPDEELAGLVEQAVQITDEEDTVEFINRTKHYNGDESNWYNLREDLKLFPDYFRLTEQLQLNYKEGVDLLFALIDSDEYHFEGISRKFKFLIKVLEVSLSNKQDLKSSIPELKELLALEKWQGAIKSRLHHIVLGVNAGMSIAQSISFVKYVVENATSAEHAFGAINEELYSLRTLNVSGDVLYQLLMTVGGVDPHRSGGNYRMLTQLFYDGSTRTRFSQQEIADKIIEIAERQKRLQEPGQKALATIENRGEFGGGTEPLQQVLSEITSTQSGDATGIVLAVKESNEYFPESRTSELVHGILPYRTSKNGSEGLRDIRRLMQTEDFEGAWIYDEDLKIWYSLGGRTSFSIGSVQQSFNPYDVSKLSKNPLYVHIHPQGVESLIAPSRDGLTFPEYREKVTKFLASMPSGSDIKTFADLLTHSSAEVSLNALIVNSTGITEVKFPNNVERLQALSEVFTSLKDEVLLEFDVEEYNRQYGQDESDLEFVQRLTVFLNSKLPEGFEVVVHPYDDFAGNDSGSSNSAQLPSLTSSPVGDSVKLGTDTKGGIDFNPNNINLSEQGDKMQINFSATDIQNLNLESINGILPVIINISPLPSIMPLLGLAPQKEKDYLEVSSLN